MNKLKLQKKDQQVVNEQPPAQTTKTTPKNPRLNFSGGKVSLNTALDLFK